MRQGSMLLGAYVAQIGYASAVAVIIGRFGITGQKPFQGGEMPAVALQQGRQRVISTAKASNKDFTFIY
jgi:hypothetical protein